MKKRKRIFKNGKIIIIEIEPLGDKIAGWVVYVGMAYLFYHLVFFLLTN
jgi:hypothetical protein